MQMLADEFISTLPEGYDTVIDEEADNISQGEKQLLTIARAILKDPKVLILDEATSSIDTKTEKNILQKFLYLTKLLAQSIQKQKKIYKMQWTT